MALDSSNESQQVARAELVEEKYSASSFFNMS